jgi:hypothetical protein
MKEILLQAAQNCAKRYAKNIPDRGFENLWDEKLTVTQKVTELAKELESTGYVLLKRVSIKVDDDLAIFNDNSGGE